MPFDIERGIPVADARPSGSCPHCRTATTTPRDGGPSVIGSLNMDEIQTLTRNEWRRRLGSEALHRRHSEWFIRALAVLAVQPHSPIIRGQVEAGVWEAVADLRAEGGGRAAAKREFWALTLAMRDVLVDAGMEPERAQQVVAPGLDLVAELLCLPDRIGVDHDDDSA